MTAREVVKRIKSLGGTLTRQKGSHAKYATPGGCWTIVPMHSGDIPLGTLRAIERDLAPCLGADWLGRR